MAKKGKKGRRKGDSSDDDDDFVDPVKAALGGGEEEEETKRPLTKKEKKRLQELEAQKKAGKQADEEKGDAEDEEEEDVEDGTMSRQSAESAAKGGGKKGKRGKKGKKGGRGAQDSDDDDDFVDPIANARNALIDDSDESEGEREAPKRPLTKKEKRRLQEAQKLAAKSQEVDDDEDELGANEELEEEEEEEEAQALKPAHAEGGGGKKGKRGKKGKKGGRGVRDSDDDDYVDPLAEARGALVDEGEDEDTEQLKEQDGSSKGVSVAMARDALFDDDDSEENDDSVPAAAEGEEEPDKDKKKKKKKKEEKEEKKKKKKKSKREDLDEDRPAGSSSEDEKSTQRVTVGLGALSLGSLPPAAPAPVPAVLPPPATEEEAKVPEVKPAGKAKKSKLEKKLEAAAKAKAEAEAEAGLKPEEDLSGADISAVAAAAAHVEAEQEAVAVEKQERKEQKERERAMLNAMEVEEPEFYGSDQDDEADRRKKPETLEEALAKAVEAAESKSGKALTARQKKKLTADVEAKRRAEAYEAAENAAHHAGAQFSCSQTTVNENDPAWQNALDINIPSFNISAMGKSLFHNAQLQIVHGRKYGLVGPNGAGKSTLLKMLAAKELVIPPRIDVLYVEQEVTADETPAVQAVMKADKERWDLVQEQRRLERKLAKDPESDDLNDALRIVHERLADMDSDGAEAKARRILHGLGFDEGMQVKPTKHFSGGWRMRISLARALFMEPTLLLLDEPTNHLDLDAVIWLDDYLQRWKKTLFIVSHDQDFLNSVCEEIIHLDEQGLQYYKGDYDTFKEMEAQRRKQLLKDWEKQQKRIAQLKRSGQTKGKAEEQVKKSKFREPGAASKKKKEQDAIASGQATATEVTLTKRPREYTVTMHFPPVNQLQPPIIQVMDISFRYGSGPFIFKDVEFGIHLDSRVCIVGANGSGKSTILKLMTGDLEPTTGDIRRNPRLRPGIYNQHFMDRLPMDMDPVSYLRSKFPDKCDYQSARNLLGKFGLEGHAHTIKNRDLSGGQKARVVFCELQLLAPHILFLDEPTNNLDQESIDALCDAINEFDGGLVVITHDARLIRATDCRLWICEEQKIIQWKDSFDDYRNFLLKRLEDRIAEQEARRAASASAKAAAKKS